MRHLPNAGDELLLVNGTSIFRRVVILAIGVYSWSALDSDKNIWVGNNVDLEYHNGEWLASGFSMSEAKI